MIASCLQRVPVEYVLPAEYVLLGWPAARTRLSSEPGAEAADERVEDGIDLSSGPGRVG